MIRPTIIAMAAIVCGSSVCAQTSCLQPALLNEHRDAPTILRLEGAWNSAFLNGDTALERCILAPDFSEILRNGEVKGLADELAFARAHIGKPAPGSQLPKLTVLLHGSVAVAYGRVSGKHRATRYADFYVWESGRWHALFAQQTPASAE